MASWCHSHRGAIRIGLFVRITRGRAGDQLARTADPSPRGRLSRGPVNFAVKVTNIAKIASRKAPPPRSCWCRGSSFLQFADDPVDQVACLPGAVPGLHVLIGG